MEFSTFMQCVWLTVFVLGGFSVLGTFKEKLCKSGDVAVLQLSLMGLTAFVTLFESRTRYLFAYAPIFVVCAAVGLFAVIKIIGEKKKES